MSFWRWLIAALRHKGRDPMLPATFNLELYQGDDFSMLVEIHVRNSDGTVGAAVDLTGYTGTAQIRATPTTNVIIATLTVAIAADQTTNRGQATISLGHVATTSLPIPSAVPFAWDLQFVTPTGTVNTYLKGSVVVDAEVTR